MSIWEIGLQYLNNKEKDNDLLESETTLFFLGDKNAGKSTIINRFLDKTENPKPSVALHYSYGRQTRGQNIPKLISHVWELGGGTWLQKLIEVAVTADNIKSLTIILVVDLSEPLSIFFTIDCLLNTIRARINFILDKNNDDGVTKSLLQSRMEDRIGQCEERGLMDPLLVPLLIIGGKYDKFRELDLKSATIICKSLRFLNRYYGGSLLFFGAQQEAIVNRLRAQIRHYAFGSSSIKTVETSPKNPLSIPVGADSFADIGSPEFKDGNLNKAPGENLVQFWKRAYFSFFSPKDAKSAEIPDPGKNPQFLEAQVDEAKRIKDEELEKYRKLSDRRMRDLRQQAINDGIIVI